MAPKEAARTDLKDLLLREGVVNFQQLNEILSEQERTKDPLLEILIRKEGFNSKKLVDIFSAQYGYTAINPAVFMIEDEVLSLVPKQTAQKFTILPITRLENTLTVAFANPTNVKVIDELQAVTGMRIKVVVADTRMIQKHIAINYDRKGKGDVTGEKKADDEKAEKLEDLVKMIEGEQGDAGKISEADLLKVAYETPVIKLVNNLLLEGIRRKASDIFIEPWESHVRVRTRVDGLLEEVIKPPKGLGEAIVSRIKVMSDLNIAEHRIPQDGRFKIKMKEREVDMRVSILPSSFGEKVCLRILDTSSQGHDLSKLGFNEREQQVIKDCARKPHGMILVTGPTGSGKTTTLYSVLKYLDAPEFNITTVEDPVEYQLSGINQVNVKDAVGLTFPAALRSILRQDPNIILIGEIRDSETLDIAVKAALTGHLVLSTLHTNDSTSSITRMVNMGLEPFLIASTVLMISAQRLVRRLCPKCRTEEAVEERVLKQIGLQGEEKNPVKFYRGRGCAQCRQSGYTGRSVITEICQISPEVRQAIMQSQSPEYVKALAHHQGMTTLRECALAKALTGETSLDEVFRVTTADQGLDRYRFDDMENIKKESRKAA